MSKNTIPAFVSKVILRSRFSELLGLEWKECNLFTSLSSISLTDKGVLKELLNLVVSMTCLGYVSHLAYSLVKLCLILLTHITLSLNLSKSQPFFKKKKNY